LLYFGIVFSPWAFGTTQAWSQHVMNAVGFSLGGLLACKWLIRLASGYRPVRWGSSHAVGAPDAGNSPPQPRPSTHPLSRGSDREQAIEQLLPCPRFQAGGLVTASLAFLTALLLAYTLISALNARATFVARGREFVYFDAVSWLPHSYDQAATWSAFWMCLGLACVFWAARDWLLTVSRPRPDGLGLDAEDDPGGAASASPGGGRAEVGTNARSSTLWPRRYALPRRLRRLLFVVCLNGGLLAVEGIVQRLAGANKLLFFVEPSIHKQATSQFGPYAYRGSASQFLNLIWPVCLGYAWVRARAASQARRLGLRHVSRAHLWLGGGAVVMAAAPVISACRGGAVIAAGLIPLAVAALLVANQAKSWRVQLGVFLTAFVTLELAGFLGWDSLAPRLETMFTDNLSGRPELWENARRMAAEHPVFGTGPGTFSTLYHLYRPHPTDPWEAYAHDDWLELRITFGWIGFSLALALLLALPCNWLYGTGLQTHWIIPANLALALGGCLFHAKFDFPFRIYSVVFLFVLLGGILTCLERRR
jgi:O-antigen ligase